MNPQTTNPRRILRSRSDRVVAGVAAGFGHYFGVDPVLIRFGLVLLTFLGGIGAFVYLVAWLVVPEESATDPAEPPAKGSRAMLWIMAIALVVVVLSGGIGRIGLGLRGDLFWPLVLIGGGVAILWWRSKSQAPEIGARDAVAVTTDAAPTTTEPAQTTMASATVPPPATVVPAAAAPPAGVATGAGPAARRKRSPLQRAAPSFLRFVTTVLGAALAFGLTAGLVVVVEGPGDLVITALEVVAVSIVLIALAIWAGLRWHRVPDLLFIALAVIVVLAFAAWLRPPLHGGYGTRDIRPTTAASIEKSYELAGGKLHIDMSDAPPGGRAQTLHAATGIGSIVIVVPDDATVALDAHVGAGELCAFGLRERGSDIGRRTTAAAQSGRRLNVQADLGVGRLTVVRASAQHFDECSDGGQSPVVTPTPTAPAAPVSPPVPTAPPTPFG